MATATARQTNATGRPLSAGRGHDLRLVRTVGREGLTNQPTVVATNVNLATGMPK